MIRELYLVELTVADWPAAVAWYRDILRFKVALLARKDRFALLEVGKGRIALKEGRPQPGTMLLTFEVADLATELQRLSTAGVTLESPIKTDDEGYRRAIIRDPDGYRLCLFEWQRSDVNFPSAN